VPARFAFRHRPMSTTCRHGRQNACATRRAGSFGPQPGDSAPSPSQCPQTRSADLAPLADPRNARMAGYDFPRKPALSRRGLQAAARSSTTGPKRFVDRWSAPVPARLLSGIALCRQHAGTAGRMPAPRGLLIARFEHRVCTRSRPVATPPAGKPSDRRWPTGGREDSRRSRPAEPTTRERPEVAQGRWCSK